MMLNDRISSFIGSHSITLSISVLLLATIGVLVQTEGASWDVTSHLLGRPETFFTPSHAMLYTGVALLIISATISAHLLRKNNNEI
ncbi:MAG TPA: hypothetical protein VE593_10330, partial [Nitrososphaeraceae archaeon]|nr:hypothetical protein [Nitrososphaeraceae archaeon]